MLGYLNNLDSTLGILFFPTRKKGVANNFLVVRPKNLLNNYKDQCIANCTISPSNTMEAVESKFRSLEALTDTIVEFVRN